MRSFDPYDLLGLTPAADVAEIRQAYCQLSRLFHPDKIPDDPHHDAFLRIQKAYSILSNRITRHAYDMFGWPGAELAISLMDSSWHEDMDAPPTPPERMPTSSPPNSPTAATKGWRVLKTDGSDNSSDVSDWPLVKWSKSPLQILQDRITSSLRQQKTIEAERIGNSVTDVTICHRMCSHSKALQLTESRVFHVLSWPIFQNGRGYLSVSSNSFASPIGRSSHQVGVGWAGSAFAGITADASCLLSTGQLANFLVGPHAFGTRCIKLKVGRSFGQAAFTQNIKVTHGGKASVVSEWTQEISKGILGHLTLRTHPLDVRLTLGVSPFEQWGTKVGRCWGIKRFGPFVGGSSSGNVNLGVHMLFTQLGDESIPKKFPIEMELAVVTAESEEPTVEMTLSVPLDHFVTRDEPTRTTLSYAIVWTCSAVTVNLKISKHLCSSVCLPLRLWEADALDSPVSASLAVAAVALLPPFFALGVGKAIKMLAQSANAHMLSVAAREFRERATAARLEQQKLQSLALTKRREEGPLGLLIELAGYGNADRPFDVTVPVMVLVRKSKLTLSRHSKRGLLGFAAHPDKSNATLFIQYRYGGKLYEQRFSDTSPVLLP